MRKSIIVVVPKGLSKGIIQSQMEYIALFTFKTRVAEVIMAIHESDKDKLTTWEGQVFIYHTIGDLKIFRGNGNVFYFRSALDFGKLLPKIIWRSEIIYDFRALVSFESYYRNRKIISFLGLFLLEGIAYLSANEIRTVSLSLKARLHQFYKVKRDISVFPCLVKEQKIENRSIATPVKFVYVGGVSKWQCIDAIIEWCRYFQKHLDAAFTFISLDRDIMERKIVSAGLRNYKILSGNHDFVQQQLKDQDFGFLVREESIINEVASPVKFLEYAGNGVIPIMSDRIGDYSKIVKEGKMGVLLQANKEAVLNQIIDMQQEASIVRSRLFALATDLSWEHYSEHSYIEWTENAK